MEKQRIFVVEDQVAVREGIVESINREDGLEVCGVAEDVQPALDFLETTKVDLVLTDLQLKASNGMELIRELRRRFPGLPIVAMTMFDPIGCEAQAYAAGASAFALKQEGAIRLLEIIRATLNPERR